MRGEAFNFSYERPMSVLQLVNVILRLMHSELEPEIRNEEVREIKRQYLSAAKAKDILGWKPRFTVEEGLEQTIEWYRAFLIKES